METGFLEESVSNYQGSTQYFRSLDPHSYRNLIQNIVGPLQLLLYLCHTPGVAPHSTQVRSEHRIARVHSCLMLRDLHVVVFCVILTLTHQSLINVIEFYC